MPAPAMSSMVTGDDPTGTLCFRWFILPASLIHIIFFPRPCPPMAQSPNGLSTQQVTHIAQWPCHSPRPSARAPAAVARGGHHLADPASHVHVAQKAPCHVHIPA